MSYSDTVQRYCNFIHIDLVVDVLSHYCIVIDTDFSTALALLKVPQFRDLHTLYL